jgi:hypothetical protein
MIQKYHPGLAENAENSDKRATKVPTQKVLQVMQRQ